MQAPDTPTPHEPIEPICTNPAYYEVFGTAQEKEIYAAYLMNEAQKEWDRRYRQLMRDIEQAGENGME